MLVFPNFEFDSKDGDDYIHCVANVQAVWPFYGVNSYVVEGGNERGREASPTSILIFDFYGTKTL